MKEIIIAICLLILLSNVSYVWVVRDVSVASDTFLYSLLVIAGLTVPMSLFYRIRNMAERHH